MALQGDREEGMWGDGTGGRRQGRVGPTFPDSLRCRREEDMLSGEGEGFCLQPSISHN